MRSGKLGSSPHLASQAATIPFLDMPRIAGIDSIFLALFGAGRDISLKFTDKRSRLRIFLLNMGPPLIAVDPLIDRPRTEDKIASGMFT